ncbi:DNA topoisomerase [Escherichia coli]|uniref:DNA topoisomerase n=1 Tax=Escherichia coli TaxID=562 RepID=UPI00388D0C07
MSETATKPEHTKPPIPLNLSTLQQICARRFGYKAKETLDIMQGLYETHKLLTIREQITAICLTSISLRLAILPTLSARRYQSWRPRPLAWIKRKT